MLYHFAIVRVKSLWLKSKIAQLSPPPISVLIVLLYVICTVLLGQANLNPPDFNFSGRPAQVWGESSMPDPAVCVDVLIMISVD